MPSKGVRSMEKSPSSSCSRRFTLFYKALIVLEYELASRQERAEIRRREGLHSSYISRWRSDFVRSLGPDDMSRSGHMSTRSVRYARADRAAQSTPRHAKPHQHGEAQIFVTRLARFLRHRRWFD